MAGMRCVCPECFAVVKSAVELRVGKKIKCPKCGRVFAVQATDIRKTPTRTPRPPSTDETAEASAAPPETERKTKPEADKEED